MTRTQVLRMTSAAGAALFALTAAGSAMAGRCGHSYPVDKPTTLAEVARQCNVSLAALREANTGVDPNNVRPGEHLAVPDEIDAYATIIAAAVQPSDAGQESALSYEDDIRDPVFIRDDESYEPISAAYPAQQTSATNRFLDQRQAVGASWIDEEAKGARGHSTAERLSYQKLSALRIQTAGRTLAPANALAAAQSQTALQQVKMSACPLQAQSASQGDDKIGNIVRANRTGFADRQSDIQPMDCSLVSASGPVMLTPGVPAAHFGLPVAGAVKSAYMTNELTALALEGDIVEVSGGCALLAGENGDFWRLSSLEDANSLLGKEVRVWGEAVAGGGGCGDGFSVSVSHIVYSEPWRRDR